MKKILFAINTLGRAGAERALINLLKTLSPEKYDIELIVMCEEGELINELPSYVKLIGNCDDTEVLSEEGRRRLRRFCVRRFIRHGNGLRLLPYMADGYLKMRAKGRIMPEKLIWRLISDGAPRSDKFYDVAIAYLEGASTYYVSDHVKAARKIAFVHVDYELAGYSRQLDRDCFENFSKVYTVSEEIKESFLSVHPKMRDKTGVFENIIDAEAIERLACEDIRFDEDYDGTRIISLGRLTDQKAYDISIEAMKLLKESGINARWYVLGDGPEKDRLEKQIKKNGLVKDFILLGAKNNPYPYLKRSDIYVHASRYEGKSLALREAKILGCAIVASDVPGNREQITDEINGLLCGLSARELADAVRRLIDNDVLRKRLSEGAENENLEKRDPEEELFCMITD